jgi:hypothetical protein
MSGRRRHAAVSLVEIVPKTEQQDGADLRELSPNKRFMAHAIARRVSLCNTARIDYLYCVRREEGLASFCINS